MRVIVYRVSSVLALVLLVGIGAGWLWQSIPEGERPEKTRPPAARTNRLAIPRPAEIPWRQDVLEPGTATITQPTCPWSGRRIGVRVEVPTASSPWVRNITQPAASAQVSDAVIPPGWNAKAK